MGNNLELVVRHTKKCTECEYERMSEVVLERVTSIDFNELANVIAKTRKGFTSHKHKSDITSIVAIYQGETSKVYNAYVIDCSTCSQKNAIFSVDLLPGDDPATLSQRSFDRQRKEVTEPNHKDHEWSYHSKLVGGTYEQLKTWMAVNKGGNDGNN